MVFIPLNADNIQKQPRIQILLQTALSLANNRDTLLHVHRQI